MRVRTRRSAQLAAFAVAGALVLLTTRPARAQTGTATAAAKSPSAADLEREARQAYARHEYAVAARGFEAANRAALHASLSFNAGLAWEQAGDPARAADAYDTALSTGGLEVEQARTARARLDSLGRTLGTLVLEGPPGALVRVDGEVPAALPVRAHLLAGVHVVTPVDGWAAAQSVTVEASTAHTVTLTAPRPDPVKVAAPVPAPDPSSPSSTSSGSSARRILGWSLAAGGVAFAGAATGLGVATLSARSDYIDNHPTDVGTYNHVVALRTATDVVFAVAAVSFVTGVVLLLTAPSASPASARTPRLTPGGLMF